MRKNKPEHIHSSVVLKVPGTRRELFISFETIEPQLAKEWLDSNSSRQRTLNSKTVTQYVSQIKKNLWYPDNGESIKFSWDEEGFEVLIDGQHRLTSCYVSKKPQLFMIIRNIDPDHIESMDLGKKRSISDIMKINGVVPPPGLNNKVLSSVIMGIYQVKAYAVKKRSDIRSQRLDSTRESQPSPLELYEFFMANPQIVKRLKKLETRDLKSISKHVTLAPAIVGWFICDVMNEEIADKLLTTMEECVPQTEMGKNCGAFKLFAYVQKCRANDQVIHKSRYPGLFVWAFDQMLRKANGKISDFDYACMPGQGHEESAKLIEYLKELKDVKN